MLGAGDTEVDDIFIAAPQNLNRKYKQSKGRAVGALRVTQLSSGQPQPGLHINSISNELLTSKVLGNQLR